jgi:transcription initiation factor TFIIIB Brf1 subunit/transcription initiation factor TFIIB
MIEMACPRCGAAGRVPKDKINARLVCKKCLQVFHLKAGGTAVMGEPPAQKQVSKERAPRERLELDVSALEGLGQKLAKMRLPDPKIIGVTLVVFMLIGICAWLFSQESVETRTQTMASAIAKGDIGTVMPMVLPGTEGEAMKWFYDIHPEYLDLKKSMGFQDPGVQIQVQKTSDGGSAQALLIFSREGSHHAGPVVDVDLQAPKPNSKAKDSLQIILYWTPDTWGTWRLDAKRTAENPARG